MLLHGDSRSQIVLRSLNVVGSHLTALVLEHDLFELFEGVKDVPVLINSGFLGRIAHLVQVIVVVILVTLLRELRSLGGFLISVPIIVSLGTFRGSDRKENLTGEAIELVHFPLAVII